VREEDGKVPEKAKNTAAENLPLAVSLGDQSISKGLAFLIGRPQLLSFTEHLMDVVL
jgi:hypothetical protein